MVLCVFGIWEFLNFVSWYMGMCDHWNIDYCLKRGCEAKWEVLKFSEEDISTIWTKSTVWNTWKHLKWLVMFRSKSKVPTYWNTKFTKTTKMEKPTCVWVFLGHKKWLKMHKRCMRYQSMKYLNTQIPTSEKQSKISLLPCFLKKIIHPNRL